MVNLGIFFEEYEYTKMSKWMGNEHSFMVKALVAYVVTIFGIKLFMRDRKPFHLERPLTFWNACLALFSSLGVFYITPALYRVIRDHGISHTYTAVSELETGKAGYWHFLWAVSKIPEFIDTLFIVLRKKPLITMHWFHHLSSCYTAFVCFANGDVFLIWCAYLNYFIHSFMYTYYCLRSNGFLVPPQVAQIITFAQIIQMSIWNCVYAHVAYLVMFTSEPVSYSPFGLFCAVFTTNSLLSMWFRFYANAYYQKGGTNKYEKHKISIASKLSIAKSG